MTGGVGEQSGTAVLLVGSAAETRGEAACYRLRQSDLEGQMDVNFTGTWNADLSKSRLVGPAPKSVLVRIADSGHDLREEVCVTTADGREQQIIFQCHTEGKDRTDGGNQALLNGTAIRGSARWEGEELVIETWMQVGPREVHFCDCWSISSDGQTLRMEHRKDDLAGQLTILNRVA